MQNYNVKESEIRVNLNDRAFFGAMRKNKENATKFFMAVRPVETKRYVFAIRITRGGSVRWRYNDQFMTDHEASAMYFKLLRESEKHIEI